MPMTAIPMCAEQYALGAGSGRRSPTWNSLKNAPVSVSEKNIRPVLWVPPAGFHGRDCHVVRRRAAGAERLVDRVQDGPVVVEHSGVEEVDRSRDVAGAARADLVIGDGDGVGRVRDPVLVDVPHLALLGACPASFTDPSS
jgi:hypothetical protein